MNAIVNKVLLEGDKPGFTYSACGSFTKNKERIKNTKKQEIHEIFIKTN